MLFGKLGQKGSFLHYPEGLLKVCVGNEIEILMLIEMLTEANIQVVASNTDGVVCMFPEYKEEEYNKICQEWEIKVGNFVSGKLEYVDFECIWEESVNHYIGKKIDGSVKKKGSFATTYELNKNKSKRIIPLAVEAYFIHNIDPIEFIKNHKNIYDFCICKKATSSTYYEEIESGVKHDKIIRYYISKDGTTLKKKGFDKNNDEVNDYAEAPHRIFNWLKPPLIKEFNKAKKLDDYNIDYNYYIIKTFEKIDAIEKTQKAKKYAENLKIHKQLNLF